MDNIKYFKEVKYRLMMHFGLHSLLGGQYLNKKGPIYAEWIECIHKIPKAEMERLKNVFNPIYFDSDRICKTAKEFRKIKIIKNT